LWPWLLIGVMMIVSNVLFGLSVVFYNGFYPYMVRGQKKYIEAKAKDKDKVLHCSWLVLMFFFFFFMLYQHWVAQKEMSLILLLACGFDFQISYLLSLLARCI